MRRSVLLSVIVHCPHFGRSVTATRNEAIDRLVACSDSDKCRDPSPAPAAGEHERLGGAAYVSINKALVTQASAAIPVVPLYISALYKVMKAAGTHEGTAEQIARLYRDHLGPGKRPTLDEAGRIRIDDLEMATPNQLAVKEVWDAVTAENVFSITDYAGFQRDFKRLFGFEVDGVDYAVPVETDVPIEPKA